MENKETKGVGEESLEEDNIVEEDTSVGAAAVVRRGFEEGGAGDPRGRKSESPCGASLRTLEVDPKTKTPVPVDVPDEEAKEREEKVEADGKVVEFEKWEETKENDD